MRKLKFIISIWLMLLASSAYACGFLDRSDPKVGEELNTSPTELKLWMTQDIDVTRSTVKLFDKQGRALHLGQPEGDNSDAAAMVAKIPTALAPGEYKVRWHVVAKGCDHITEGSYSFKLIR